MDGGEGGNTTRTIEASHLQTHMEESWFRQMIKEYRVITHVQYMCTMHEVGEDTLIL